MARRSEAAAGASCARRPAAPMPRAGRPQHHESRREPCAKAGVTTGEWGEVPAAAVSGESRPTGRSHRGAQRMPGHRRFAQRGRTRSPAEARSTAENPWSANRVEATPRRRAGGRAGARRRDGRVYDCIRMKHGRSSTPPAIRNVPRGRWISILSDPHMPRVEDVITACGHSGP